MMEVPKDAMPSKCVKRMVSSLFELPTLIYFYPQRIVNPYLQRGKDGNNAMGRADKLQLIPQRRSYKAERLALSLTHRESVPSKQEYVDKRQRRK